MNTDFWVPIISTIGVIIVAIFSTLVPACLARAKERQERIGAEQERIREAAGKLLRNLANFRHTGEDDQARASGLPSHQQATAELRGAYDIWALTVMPRLNYPQQKKVRVIRKEKLGRGNLKIEEGQDVSISTEIFELTWTACTNVR